jgi:hypothetical protein
VSEDKPEESPRKLISIDSDPFNADWTKKTWDLEIYNVKDMRGTPRV